MSLRLYESEIEQIALELLHDENGYDVLPGPDLLEGANPERIVTEVILQNRLRAAIDRLNPHIPADAREDAFRKALSGVSVKIHNDIKRNTKCTNIRRSC
jgi:type I restriction enzyme R subunit